MQHFIATYGYPALFLLALCEVACIPISSEVVLLGTGVIASTGKLNVVVAIVIAIIGETIGGYIAWGVGRTGGRRLVERYGRYLLISSRDLDRVDRWFSRRGAAAVFVGRVLPFVRFCSALPAGTAEVPAVKFGLYSFAGSVVWVTALAATGDAVGSTMQHTVNQVISNVGYVIGALAVVVIALFLVHRWRDRRHEATGVLPRPGAISDPDAISEPEAVPAKDEHTAQA